MNLADRNTQLAVSMIKFIETTQDVLKNVPLIRTSYISFDAFLQDKAQVIDSLKRQIELTQTTKTAIRKSYTIFKDCELKLISREQQLVDELHKLYDDDKFEISNSCVNERIAELFWFRSDVTQNKAVMIYNTVC